MKSAKTYLILFLAATTVGGAMLAWRQYGELVALRAAAMNPEERADLQKRIWDLEKLNRDLQDQLAAVRLVGGDMEGVLAADTGERTARSLRDAKSGERRGRGDSRDRGNSGQQQANAIRELMSKPEVQAMLTVQQKAAIDARYAALFKNLNLLPEQADKLKSLLAERTTTLMDVAAAAREQGINLRENPEAFRKLVADAQNDINKNIQSVIGDAGFAQLQTYEQTLPQRNLVEQIERRLSHTATPLSSAQAEQLVQILAANAPPRTSSTGTAATTGQTSAAPQQPQSSGGRGGPPFGGRGGDLGGLAMSSIGGGFGLPGMGSLFDGSGRGGNSVTVTPAAVSQAQTVLAPPQLAVLQQIQQQQQTQQQLQQLVRDTLAANQPQPANTKSGTNSGTTNGAPPTRKRPGGGE